MTTLLVTSKDGIVFRIETSAKAAPFERAYAARATAAELAQHEEFSRVRSLDDLVAPEFVFTAAPSRPQLRLIQGGKP